VQSAGSSLTEGLQPPGSEPLFSEGPKVPKAHGILVSGFIKYWGGGGGGGRTIIVLGLGTVLNCGRFTELLDLEAREI